MPRIDPKKTRANYVRDGAWCPGCGLYAHCNNGRHRTDCTADPPPIIPPKE